MVDSKENFKFDLGVRGLMKEWKMNERKKKNTSSQTCTSDSKKVFALSSNELLAIFCFTVMYYWDHFGYGFTTLSWKVYHWKNYLLSNL